MTDDFDTFEGLLKRRHSCRAFAAAPVPRPIIQDIVRAAGRVPSWCNAQPWQVTIAGPAETVALSAALQANMQTAAPAPDLPFPSAYTGAHKDRRRACGFQLYEAAGIERSDRAATAAQMMQNFSFFGAPHVAIVSTPSELGPYGALDCGSFISAFTLAAEAKGVASIPQAAIAPYAPFLRTYLDIPDTRLILCAISFGYADQDNPVNAFRTARAAEAEIVTWKDDA